MEEKNNHIYAEKLKYLRINKFVSQKNMAKKFKVSQQAYAKLEQGKIYFTVDKIKKICKIFNVKYDEFVTIHSKNRKTKNPDGLAIKVLKEHYQMLLLEKDVRIAELEIEIKRLSKGRKISKKPLDVYVMI